MDVHQDASLELDIVSKLKDAVCREQKLAIRQKFTIVRIYPPIELSMVQKDRIVDSILSSTNVKIAWKDDDIFIYSNYIE
jgi:hypothetical protein